MKPVTIQYLLPMVASHNLNLTRRNIIALRGVGLSVLSVFSEIKCTSPSMQKQCRDRFLEIVFVFWTPA